MSCHSNRCKLKLYDVDQQMCDDDERLALACLSEAGEDMCQSMHDGFLVSHQQTHEADCIRTRHLTLFGTPLTTHHLSRAVGAVAVELAVICYLYSRLASLTQFKIYISNIVDRVVLEM